MSEIPYYFDHPVPTYFREHGWMKKPNSSIFISWCFSRCSNVQRDIQHDGQRIILKPYQFIFGRRVCSEETGLTEDQVRTQQISMEKALFLKKAPNKTPNHFTVYEWSTEVFCKTNPQQNPQQTPNRPPTDPHKQELRTTDVSLFVSEEKEEEERTMEKVYARSKLNNGKLISVSVSDVKEQLKKDKYSEEEINNAIGILRNSEPLINTNIKNYLSGIIKKQREIPCRTKKIKEIPKKPENSKPKSAKDSGFYSENDTSGSPLAIYARQIGLS